MTMSQNDTQQDTEQDITELLIDFHQGTERQGPGSIADTELALSLCRFDAGKTLQILDLGCGTGSSTFILARHLTAHITAVDMATSFLKAINEHALKLGLSDQVHTMEASIDNLPIEKHSIDLIWAEGSIYNIGCAKGLQYWATLIKPGGHVAFSEITWLSEKRDPQIEGYWMTEYPEITTVAGNLEKIAQAGLDTIGHFILPPSSWIDSYYKPLMGNSESFLARHNHSALSKQIVEATQLEYDLYLSHQSAYSYGFYIARKPQ
jgi:SAM-dependent methyltransferase